MRKSILITNVTAPKAEKTRTDGKASRLFITVTGAEALQRKDGSYYPNPFTSSSRNVWQRHSADGKSAAWGAVSPESLNNLMKEGNAIPGEVVSMKVKQFPVLGADGKQNKRKDGTLVFADTYTTVLFGNEDAEKVFRAANHEITGSVADAPSKVEELQLQA